MKTLLPLLALAFSGIGWAATQPNPGPAPEGITSSDWAGIHAAYEASRHGIRRMPDGSLLARNPGQQWRTEFDGEGFTVTPDQGEWTWGLELTGYGNRKLADKSPQSQLREEGGKITCRRDDNLTEWFINDRRGLEQGWDIQQRPERDDPGSPLLLELSTRGSIHPEVSPGSDSVSFIEERGSKVLTYGGLKAWDATGRQLRVRFEQAGEDGIRIAVDDQNARYPITVDPIARQASLKASNPEQDDRFGYQVAISGDTVAVSAVGESSNATGVDGDQTNNAASRSGAVYIFTRTGATWTQQAYLKASNTDAADQFGYSLAFSGDTLAVGAFAERSAATGVNGDQTNNTTSGAGAVYIFTRTGATWTQQAYLKASNTGPEDQFGTSVAISGETLVVGAPFEDGGATGVNGDQSIVGTAGTGAAYVFVRSGATWTQQAYLKASNAEGQPSTPGGGAGDVFGASVAISGDTVIVGASHERSAATGVNGDQSSNTAYSAGAAYVFVRSGTDWSQQAYLKASNTEANDMFGTSVAISGDTAIVGAPNEDSEATGVNGNQAGEGVYNSGAAYVFSRSGATWTQQAYLKAGTALPDRGFGWSLASSGDTLIVGAYSPWNNANTGAVCVFSRTGTVWSPQAQLDLPLISTATGFGSSVAISGNLAVAGAPEKSNVSDTGITTSKAGSAYTIDLNVDVLPPAISVKQGGVDYAKGATKWFGFVAEGDSFDSPFSVSNLGQADLILTGTPKVVITGSSDFTVTQQPDSPVSGSTGSTTFNVRFTPTSGGSKSALLSIASNDGIDAPFVINLTGGGLSYTIDTDGDGLSDAMELKTSALGFNWQVKQTASVNAYLASANRAGRYAESQVHALRLGATQVTRDQASGRIKLTTHWQKSTNLVDFFDLAAPAGSQVSINPSGGIEFEFPSPDDAAFLKVESE